MSNVHGLFSGRNRRDNEPPSDDEDEDPRGGGDNRYVGGVDSRGGGSGLAVQPNPEHDGSGGGGGPSDAAGSIFNLASNATPEDGPAESSQRRVITMYRDGFTVDDGPYRRLNDPANATFLGSLARGVTPRELVEDGNENITVGLVDKRGEDYVEEFRSFSGAGTSLGGASASGTGGGGGGDGSGVIHPDQVQPAASSPAATGGKMTSIQVRLLNGKRIVAKVPVTSSVRTLVQEISSSGQGGSDSYVLMAGFPPRQVMDLDQTIEDAGLAGSSVQQKKFTG